MFWKLVCKIIGHKFPKPKSNLLSDVLVTLTEPCKRCGYVKEGDGLIPFKVWKSLVGDEEEE